MMDKFYKWLSEEATNTRYDFINKKMINIPIRNIDKIEILASGFCIGIVVCGIIAIMFTNAISESFTNFMDSNMCRSLLEYNSKFIDFKNDVCLADVNGTVVEYRLYYDSIDMRYKLSLMGDSK